MFEIVTYKFNKHRHALMHAKEHAKKNWGSNCCQRWYNKIY